ncbi:hypothetical protein KR067_003813 [Drosophila pandora]|nr:hypothetical protein KR067_003813 [Drosophila pandora]
MVVLSAHPNPGGPLQDDKVGTLDVLLSSAYCRSQRFLSKQLAQLRPELTMSIFSEITHRFQSAREDVRALLLQCLLPWLQNMELVATSVPPATPLSYIMPQQSPLGIPRVRSSKMVVLSAHLNPGGPLQDDKVGTLDVLLSSAYCRSQRFLSKQLAQLRPELTMSIFSEITHRFQSAREDVRALLLQCLLPWLQNMELVATSVPPATPLSYIMYFPDSGTRGRREGTGSTEATEMILNNLFYITAKFSDAHPRDIEELWGTLCQFWPNNLKVILRYLVIMSGMAPTELLPYAKRVALYLARSCPDRLLDELMAELQTVETLNCLIERTETPPFYRLTSMRKASSHSADGQAGVGGINDSRIQDLAVEKGTIHTKRHSGEDPIKIGQSDSGIRAYTHAAAAAAAAAVTPGSNGNRPPRGADKIRAASGPSILPRPEDILINDPELRQEENVELRGASDAAANAHPHPLPMPEYGGYFAPLTEFLPDVSLPISGFHR